MLRTTLIAVALASGGGAAWLALSASTEATPKAQMVVAESPAMEDVLVAAAAVPEGGKIGPDQLTWQSWPQDAVQTGFVSRSARPDAVGEFAGFIARSQLVAGEPIIGEKLAPAGSGFLSAMLEPGTRAVAVRVSAESSAGGFVLPNDRVDVLHTTPCAPEDGCSAATRTRTILRSVKILAIDQQAKEGSPEAVVVGKTATLELTPSQSELVIGAESSGMLSLALRPATEDAESEVVFQAEDPMPETRTVRVRRGSAVDEVVVH